ncbi:MAG TPA: RNase adapter RapZ, partial [Longimicrobium sp.]
SLLWDPKVGLTEALREELLEEYLEHLDEYLPRVDRNRFRQHLRGYVLVRIMQAMGAYGYRGFFERKPRFLQSVPGAIRNMERLLETGFVPVDLPELREVLERICGNTVLRKKAPTPMPGLTVYTGSFSYKGGYPDDAGGHGGGFVFDCRAIHNPGRYAEYASLCGCDEPVENFLESLPEVEDFWGSVRGLVEHHVGAWLTRGFGSLSVYFGCTGGQHRSVYFAERLGAYLRANYPSVNIVVTHREQPRWEPARAEALALSASAGVEAGAAEVAA